MSVAVRDKTRPKLDGKRPLGEMLWNGLEKHYAHLHLGPVAALFALAEARYDTPVGYHAPPPLAPMVHYGRSLAEVPLKAFAALATTCNDDPAAVIATDVPLEGLPAYARFALVRDDDALCYCGVLLLQKLLSVNDPRVATVVETGIVPRLAELVTEATDTDLVFSALWTLTHIASGSSTQLLAVTSAKGYEGVIKQALSTTSESVAEQAAWALGSLAERTVHYRDYSIDLGAIDALQCVIERFPMCVRVVSNAVFALVKHFEVIPAPPLHVLRPILPPLFQLLRHADASVRRDAVWALHDMSSQGSEDLIEELLPALPWLAALLADPESNLAMPTIVTVAMIGTGTDEQVSLLLESEALHHFVGLIVNGRPGVRQHTCSTLSNIIASGADRRIEAVIHAGLVPVLLNVITTDSSGSRSALWAIAELTWASDPEQIHIVVNAGLFRCLLPRLVTVAEPVLLHALFKALHKCVNLSDGLRTEWNEAVREYGNVTSIRTVARTHGADLAQIAESLLRDFGADDDDT